MRTPLPYGDPMTSRGARGLCLRGVAAAGACLLALASTGAMVTAAVVGGSGPTAVLTHDTSEYSTNDSTSFSHRTPEPRETVPPRWTPKPAPTPQPKPTPKLTPTPKPTPKPAPKPATTSHSPAQQTHPKTPAPTPKVVVDTADPAPFSAQAVAATEAARVFPVESLGPLSGVSFGSGLFIWPILVAVDVLALAVIARMALRRRLVAPGD
jgi:hypothetical protein